MLGRGPPNLLQAVLLVMPELGHQAQQHRATCAIPGHSHKLVLCRVPLVLQARTRGLGQVSAQTALQALSLLRLRQRASIAVLEHMPLLDHPVVLLVWLACTRRLARAVARHAVLVHIPHFRPLVVTRAKLVCGQALGLRRATVAMRELGHQ